MAKKDKHLYFTTGVNIPDGDGEKRFEKGEKVPDLSPSVMKALVKLNAVAEVKEDEVQIREDDNG